MNRIYIFEKRFNEESYPLHHPFYVKVSEWYSDHMRRYHSSIDVIKVDNITIEPGGVDDYMLVKNHLFTVEDSISTDSPDYKDKLHTILISLFNKVRFEDGKNRGENERI